MKMELSNGENQHILMAGLPPDLNFLQKNSYAGVKAFYAHINMIYFVWHGRRNGNI